MTVRCIGDHVRPTDDYPDGIYRVVGTSDEGVTLLRVGDADDRRVTTGELPTVDHDEFAGFAPAEHPEKPSARVRRRVAGGGGVRVFVRQLIAHPRPTAVATALVLAGGSGDRTVSLPDVAFGGLLLAGGLALAYVGSGRLER